MTTAQLIDDKQAIELLQRVGMTLGEWHRIGYLEEAQNKRSDWRNVQKPSDAGELLVFAQRILDWLPELDGYVAAFDNSNSFRTHELLIFQAILGLDLKAELGPSGAIAMEFEGKALDAKVRLSYFIFFCLIFEAHLYVVNARQHQGPILGVIDGFAYFIGGDQNANKFIRDLEIKKKDHPEWVVEYESGI